ncbi:MAG TPA: hypothetical protein VH703_02540 [Solirubrobacterales bacterium]|jgi:hypothetical protein
MAKGDAGGHEVELARRKRARRDQGSAVAALNAFTADRRGKARKKLGLAEPGDAIGQLAAAAGAGALHVPRLFVLDSLVKLASRRGDLSAYRARVDELLEGLVRDAGVPDAEVEEAVATARDALEVVDQRRGDPEAGPAWHAFAERAAGALRLTRAEVEKPLCDDDGVVSKGGHEARGVTVEFHTDAAPGAMRRFCDPTRWHEASAYQHEMTPWQGPGAVSVERSGGWRRDLVETVDLTPTKQLVTPLRFTFSTDRADDPRWVHLDYVLLAPTEDIAVDEGSLEARRVTRGRHRGRTRVRARKAIFFTDPLFQEWTSISCDTFWTDTVIAAAVGSSYSEET